MLPRFQIQNHSNNMANISAKKREQVSFRTHTPSQSAAMLSFLGSNDVFQMNVNDDPQTVFDELYSVLNALLNLFYPIKKITVSNRDPYFMTPRIKSLLRVKNKLMRKGRVEKAECISKRILKLIIAKNVSIFSPANPIKDTRDLWSRVNDITGKGGKPKHDISCTTADELNIHYSTVSTDHNYVRPLHRVTVGKPDERISEEQVFKLLDTLKNSSPGRDSIPSWFLRTVAPFLAKPLSEVYNLSLNRNLCTKTMEEQYHNSSG